MTKQRAESEPEESRPGRKSTEGQTAIVRINASVLKWVEGQSALRGGLGRSAILTEAIEGVASYFSSAPRDLEILEAEAKAQGLSTVTHFSNIISEYRDRLRAQQAAHPKK